MKTVLKGLLIILAMTPLCSCENTLFLKSLFLWSDSVNKDNVVEVTLETGYIGTSPDNTLISFVSSKDSRDIEYNLNFLNSAKIENNDYDIMGGKYLLITYIKNDNSKYSIRINNSFVHVDNTSFKITSENLPKILYNE